MVRILLELWKGLLSDSKDSVEFTDSYDNPNYITPTILVNDTDSRNSENDIPNIISLALTASFIRQAANIFVISFVKPFCERIAVKTNLYSTHKDCNNSFSITLNEINKY